MPITEIMMKECAKTYIFEYGQDLEKKNQSNSNFYKLSYKFCNDCAFFNICIVPILKKNLLQRNDNQQKRSRIKKRIDTIFHQCLYRDMALEIIKKAGSS